MNKRITITNNLSEAMRLQIEPWADMFYLLPMESICIISYCQHNQGIEYELEAIDHENNQVLEIDGVNEYFIVEGDLEIHHLEYGSNIDGWSKPLHEKSTLKKKNISI